MSGGFIPKPGNMTKRGMADLLIKRGSLGAQPSDGTVLAMEEQSEISFH